MAPVKLSPDSARAWGLALSIGWRIAAGVLVGAWIDGRFETTPIFVTVLSIGALVSAVADLLRSSKSGPGDDAGA